MINLTNYKIGDGTFSENNTTTNNKPSPKFTINKHPTKNKKNDKTPNSRLTIQIPEEIIDFQVLDMEEHFSSKLIESLKYCECCGRQFMFAQYHNPKNHLCHKCQPELEKEYGGIIKVKSKKQIFIENLINNIKKYLDTIAIEIKKII